MKPDHDLHERLLRMLNGHVSPSERDALEAELNSKPEARTVLRDLAEQVVMIADIERTAGARHRGSSPATPAIRSNRGWHWGLAAAACLVAVFGAAALWFRAGGRELARVVKVTGVGSYFGTRGVATDIIQPGMSLRAGDALETRSCDSWIEVELLDGTHLTIAGQSTMRLLAPSDGVMRLELPRGNLWSSPGPQARPDPLAVRTPTAVVETRGAQFDMQSGTEGAFVRVNAGSARAVRTLDGSVAAVGIGHQASLTLNPRDVVQALPQPPPVTSWALDIGDVPDVILGRWLPSNTLSKARLGAVPLLFPIPDRAPITLHVVGLSVVRSAGQPVLLQRSSRIHFRGLTSRPHTVRFGFSTQRMRGVFAGKFELDVAPAELGAAGQIWEITKSIHDFRPLQPQLAADPDGLELYDLYALTILEDVGLEIHHVEVSPVIPVAPSP